MELVRALIVILVIFIISKLLFELAAKNAGRSQTEIDRVDARMRAKPKGQISSYDYNGGNVHGAKFRMVVEDVFSIKGRGTIVTGKTEVGPIQRGDAVVILKADGQVLETKINAIEQFRKSLNFADPGSNAGLLLDNIERDQVQRGDTIVKY